jgi:hypothetical protein
MLAGIGIVLMAILLLSRKGAVIPAFEQGLMEYWHNSNAFQRRQLYVLDELVETLKTQKEEVE